MPDRPLLAAAARLIVEDNLDPDEAVRRAARRLGLRTPSGAAHKAALDQAVAEYQALFHPEQRVTLDRQRQLARDALRAVKPFRPRLFGAVADGHGRLDRIRLLLIADSAEDVIMHLVDRGIPWHSAEVTLPRSRGRRERLPAIRFEAGDSSVELVVADRSWLSDPPIDPVDGSPLRLLTEQALDHAAT